MERSDRAVAGRVLVLEPGRAERHYWRDLWRYRELFSILAWRDIAVRYKQTVIGVAWALIRPFLTMVVFTVIFGGSPSCRREGDAPYALMVFAGMLPWTFFSTALTEASNSLIGNANLISKVYFPRLIVPTAAVVVAFVDFLISFAILVVLMVWYRFLPGWQIAVAAGLRLAGVPRQPRSGPVDHRPEREVPRLPLRHSVHRAVRALHLAGRLQLHGHPGAMAAPLFAQSDGRRHRRLSLVHPGRPERALLAGLRAQPRRHRVLPVARHPPVPQDGKELRRPDLSSGSAERRHRCPTSSSRRKSVQALSGRPSGASASATRRCAT